jgi:DNA-binding response OmpR family regulator
MVKILIIDDELNLQRLIRANLAARGYQVLAAIDGATGLKLAAQEVPDIVLLDLMLPDILGWDVLASLKDNPVTKDIPVVIMTALDEKSPQVKGRLTGRAGYLDKPFGVEELLAVLDSILNKKVP